MHPCVLSELSELSALSDRPRPQYRLRAMCPAATRVSITPAQRGGRNIARLTFGKLWRDFPTFRPADWFWAKHKSNRRTRKGLEKDEGVQRGKERTFPQKVFPSPFAVFQNFPTEFSRRILARMASRRAASGRAQATTNQQVICSRLFRKSRMAVFQAAVSSE